METTETTEKIKRNARKERVGKVVSDKMNKTITVVVETKYKHAKYGKILSKTKKFMAHDELEVCNIGDTVRIIECRPLSKNKCWRLVSVVEKAK
jgi:small subunit ribosomal protein S17